MDLTKYAALNIEITKYSKVNSQFSIGRARVFYEGPNVNRTIIPQETAIELIKTVPGTPIVGRFNIENDDFEGHGDGQIAYGFVPLEPNTLKVEIVEEVFGLPIRKTYYEVDVVIWDGRFPEAQKILGEEKSLSMELNPETIEGEFEIYDDKTYLKITKAEFFGITVLGDGHTPCFKDARFLQTYTSMLSAYESLLQEQESNKGGKNMPKNEEVETVELTEENSTNLNEETSVEEVEVEAEEVETEATEAEEIEVETPEEEAEEAEEETSEEEAPVEETYEEESTGNDTDAEEVEEAEVEEEEVEEAEAEEGVNFEAEIENLQNQVKDLTAKLEVYETAAKEELIDKFASKINDSDFLAEVKNNLADYSVESLKSTLGAKLAEQVLVEETNDEEKVNGIIYSFNGVARKETKKGWQELVRATKNASKNN